MAAAPPVAFGVPTHSSPAPVGSPGPVPFGAADAGAAAPGVHPHGVPPTVAPVAPAPGPPPGAPPFAAAPVAPAPGGPPPGAPPFAAAGGQPGVGGAMAGAAAMMGEFKLAKMIPRIKLLFSNPTAYWDEMAGDQGGVRQLLPTVIAFVGAAALAQLIGTVLMALRVGMARLILWFLIGGVIQAILALGLGVLTWYLVAVLINAFAKTFETTPDSASATKVALGALLPMWLGQLLWASSIGAVAMLGGLGGFGYGCYLMYVGLQRVMGAPQPKAVVYTLAVMGISLVIVAVIGVVVGGITGCVTGCALTSSIR